MKYCKVAYCLKEYLYASVVHRVHIRRTDKLMEVPATYRPIEAYMNATADFFRKNYPNERPRHVLLASDDHEVVKEILQRYLYIVMGYFHFPIIEC